MNGTLLALGLKRRQIFRLVLLENTLLGLVGGILGVVAGLLLATAISSIGLPMPPPPGSNAAYTASIRIVPWVVGVAALTGAAAATLAAMLPGRRASRLVALAEPLGVHAAPALFQGVLVALRKGDFMGKAEA